MLGARVTPCRDDHSKSDTRCNDLHPPERQPAAPRGRHLGERQGGVALRRLADRRPETVQSVPRGVQQLPVLAALLCLRQHEVKVSFRVGCRFR